MHWIIYFPRAVTSLCPLLDDYKEVVVGILLGKEIVCHITLKQHCVVFTLRFLCWSNKQDVLC